MFAVIQCPRPEQNSTSKYISTITICCHRRKPRSHGKQAVETRAAKGVRLSVPHHGLVVRLIWVQLPGFPQKNEGVMKRI